MADCPGVLHLAQMADGGLARLRVPGGALTAAQLAAVADAAERFGSGVVDLTNRANLQIRGVSGGDAGALAARLEQAGFQIFGEADRRRNILLDPFAGLDPTELRDLRPLAGRLDMALVAAPWISGLSPKFSFVLDGGGASGVSAVPSDVVALAEGETVVVAAGGEAATFVQDEDAARAMAAIAETAARRSEDARAADLGAAVIRDALASAGGAPVPPPTPRLLAPRLGAVATKVGGFAVSPPVPVGRLDAATLRFLADASTQFGEGRARLAPWSAVVLPGVLAEGCETLLALSEVAGFTSVATAERLVVVACAGAPACERAQEPAKALGADILKLAASNPDLLPAGPRRLHLSACPKGCAGSSAADVLLLGSSERGGWAVHRDGAPRTPGVVVGRLEAPTPAAILALLAR